MHTRLGKTALSIAKIKNYGDIIIKLIKAGANTYFWSEHELEYVNSQLSGRPFEIKNRTQYCGSLPWDTLHLYWNKFPEDINAITKEGKFFLMMAAEHDRNDIVDFLIARGVDLNLQHGKMKITALHIAAEKGNIDVVRSLLASGANSNIPDKKGVTSIMKAASHNQLEIVKILTPYADSNIDYVGHGIRTTDNVKMATYFLDNFITDINFVDKDRNSYLHIAVENKIFKKKRIDESLVNSDGKTAIELTADN